jgi:hypothetical protein
VLSGIPPSRAGGGVTSEVEALLYLSVAAGDCPSWFCVCCFSGWRGFGRAGCFVNGPGNKALVPVCLPVGGVILARNLDANHLVEQA